jgi:nucleoside-diphosphate-sugar epimerase
MNRKNILITGSSGLIGHAVARRLSREYNVIGFDHEGPPEQIDTDDIFVNLESDESVQNAFHLLRSRHGDQIESVIHLAAFYDFSGKPSSKYDTVTVEGTGRMLRELERFHCRQFLFSSTMLVYAPCQPGQKIDENWPLQPKWAYPISKVKTEKLIHEQRHDIQTVILRIAGVYDDFCHSIPIAHQIQRIYERQLLSHVFPGDLSHGQSFVHLDDLVDCIANAIERRPQLPPETTLLIGEPVTFSYGRLQNALGRLIYGTEWFTQPMPKALAKAGSWVQNELPLPEEPFIKPWMIDIADDHYELDVSLARDMIGFTPKRNLLDTLPLMTEALKADLARFYALNKLHGAGRMHHAA